MRAVVPSVDIYLDVREIIGNFLINWRTLGPVLWLLFGTLAAFTFLHVIKKKLGED